MQALTPLEISSLLQKQFAIAGMDEAVRLVAMANPDFALTMQQFVGRKQRRPRTE